MITQRLQQLQKNKIEILTGLLEESGKSGIALKYLLGYDKEKIVQILETGTPESMANYVTYYVS